MKLRWSDGHSYAEVFHAVDEESLVANGLPALRIFRLATGRMVHRGDVTRNEFWGGGARTAPRNRRALALAWLHREGGRFRPFGRRVVFQSIPGHVPPQHGGHHRGHERRGVYDCWRWSGAIDAMIMEVGDMLPGPGDDQ